MLSGFSYEMFFDFDLAADDVLSAYGGVKVVVDPDQRQPADRVNIGLQRRPSRRRVQHQQPQRYVSVIDRFFRAVADAAAPGATVRVHDYHLQLVFTKMLRVACLRAGVVGARRGRTQGSYFGP